MYLPGPSVRGKRGRAAAGVTPGNGGRTMLEPPAAARNDEAREAGTSA
jgi:hypothetical protein